VWSGTGCWTSGAVAFLAAARRKNRAEMIGKIEAKNHDQPGLSTFQLKTRL
jgi:hypothetical protein